MNVLLQLFLNICLLKKAPQDIPYSPLLLKLIIIIYAAIAFLALAPTEHFFYTAFEVLVEISVTWAFVWIMLAWTNKSARFTQVLCAFLGTDALISFLALPAILAAALGHTGSGMFIILFLLMIWHWVVCGHIISHSLSKPLLFGLGVAFLYSFGFYHIMDWLFPGNAG